MIKEKELVEKRKENRKKEKMISNKE